MKEFKEAVSKLPNLTALGIYLYTPRAASYLDEFLDDLPSCPKVASLRVAAHDANPILKAKSLRCVTNLYLGQGISVDGLLKNLRNLHLQHLQNGDLDQKQVLEGLENCLSCPSIVLESFDVNALSQLPTNLQCLSAMQSFPPEAKSEVCMALTRLTQLEVLKIGNFCGDFVLSLFQGITLPRLYTFGFCIHPRKSSGFVEQHEFAVFETGKGTKKRYQQETDPNAKMHVNPHRQVAQLKDSLPRLGHIQVSFCHSEPGDHLFATFNAYLFRKRSFPNLKLITCHCVNTSLELLEVQQDIGKWTCLAPAVIEGRPNEQHAYKEWYNLSYSRLILTS